MIVGIRVWNVGFLPEVTLSLCCYVMNDLFSFTALINKKLLYYHYYKKTFTKNLPTPSY